LPWAADVGQRAELPVRLFGRLQKREEFTGSGPEIADAVWPRQRGEMQEDTAGAFEFHISSLGGRGVKRCGLDWVLVASAE